METCFSYMDGKCRILTAHQCSDLCVFYLTTKQAAERSRRADNRLSSLDYDYQRYIAEKYYKGRMPWLRGGVAV